MSIDREQFLNQQNRLPRMAGGSGEVPFVPKAAARRKSATHAELSATLDVIKNFDPSDLPDGEGRGIIKRFIKK